MSENYRFYVQKMIEGRVTRPLIRPSLRRDLDELFEVVERCEKIWAIEERIERSLG